MKLYLLRLKPNRKGPQWGIKVGVVVAARTEEQARRRASESSLAETDRAWLSPRHSTCSLIGTADSAIRNSATILAATLEG